MVQRYSKVVLAVVFPLLLTGVILFADVIEGPKTAYVGVLSAIPLLSAVFGTPRSTALVSVITWLSAFTFGRFAADGNVRAQTVRLVILAIFSVIAVMAAFLRTRQERRLAVALTQAAQADAMRHQAQSDSLTGLLNRRGVLERIRDCSTKQLLVSLIDIDEFKDINDRYGHLVGDEVIQAVAARIEGGLSREDVIGRWGGDEFVIVLEMGLEFGSTVIQRVFDRVNSQPLSTSAGRITVGISGGLCAWDRDEALESVLARADLALYAAKHDGRKHFVVGTRG